MVSNWPYLYTKTMKQLLFPEDKRKVYAYKFSHGDGNISVSRSFKKGKLYLWFPSWKLHPLANAQTSFT